MKRESLAVSSYFHVLLYSCVLLIFPIAAEAGVFTLLGSADTVPSSEGWALDVAVSGNYAYVAQNAAGLQVFDISDLCNPVAVGAVTGTQAITNVAVDGNHVYALWSGSEEKGLYTIDATDPANPSLLATRTSPTRCNGMAVANGRAYLAESEGLQILDISDPASPSLLGTYATSNMAWRVAVEGDLAYLMVHGYDTECGRQLQILNVSNPAAPVMVGSCCLPDTYDADYGDYLSVYCYEINVKAGYAYLAWADGMTGGYFAGRLDTIDVSDPAHPVRCGIFMTSPGVRGMALDGDNVYLCVKQENLQALNGTAPCEPSYLGFTEAWGAMNACARDGYVFLANGSFEDLMVFEVDSDRDGLSDHEETSALTNPYARDTDGDRLSDFVEVNNYGTDPLKADTDDDGANDADEVAFGTDPCSATETLELPLSAWCVMAAAISLAAIAAFRLRRAHA